MDDRYLGRFAWGYKPQTSKKHARVSRVRDRSIYYTGETSQYPKADRLMKKLIKKYKGVSWEEAIGRETVSTRLGDCYVLTEERDVSVERIDKEETRLLLLCEFQLLYGVGEVKREILVREGFSNIEELVEHPRFGESARSFMRILDGADVYALMNWVARWFARSHPLTLGTCGMLDMSDMVFFDLETMGLSMQPIILFGMARFKNGKFVIKQYIMRDLEQEPAGILCALEEFSDGAAVVTFNGRSFDMPYLEDRANYYRIKTDLGRVPNYDMYHFSRRRWRPMVTNCKLSTLEKEIFGINREGDVPGAMVPEYYQTYRKINNVGPLIPIIEHNRQDLVTLALLLSTLVQELRDERI